MCCMKVSCERSACRRLRRGVGPLAIIELGVDRGVPVSDRRVRGVRGFVVHINMLFVGDGTCTIRMVAECSVCR
jgi:hypothetical protein